MTEFARWSWAEVAAQEPTLLVVPLGATEQHGPHLPLGTDTTIAKAFAARLADQLPGVVVGPEVPYGSSGEHQGFAGTISIGQDVLRTVVVEIGRSASCTFPRVLFVSAHGGNAVPVADAVRLLRSEGRDVYAWSPALSWKGDAHAGCTETSVMLALHPTQVRTQGKVRGDMRPLGEIMEILRTDGIAAVTHTGVLGDPTLATAEEGHHLFLRATHELSKAVDNCPAHNGVWL
jgi:mycofactocin precursor peptide peptidase